MIRNGSRPWADRRKAKTSCLRTLPFKFVRARLRSMAPTAAEFSSTKSAEAAPRLSASMPSAPVPAKRSRTFAPMISSPRLEKIAAFTRSMVGRTSPLFGTSSRMPPAAPAITLMAWRWARAQGSPLAQQQQRQASRVGVAAAASSAAFFFFRSDFPPPIRPLITLLKILQVAPDQFVHQVRLRPADCAADLKADCGVSRLTRSAGSFREWLERADSASFRSRPVAIRVGASRRTKRCPSRTTGCSGSGRSARQSSPRRD